MKTFIAVLAVALGISVVFYQRTLGIREREIKNAATEQAEIDRLTVENQQIERLREENKEVARLRDANRDLHKFRSEVQQLREQAKALPLLRAENQRLNASHAAAQKDRAGQPVGNTSVAVTIPAEQLRFAGLATPEATLQSLFWGIRAGNRETVLSCVTPEGQKEAGWSNEAGFRQTADEMKMKLKALRILGKKQISADEVIVAAALQLDGGRGDESDSATMALKRIGNEWKVTGK